MKLIDQVAMDYTKSIEAENKDRPVQHAVQDFKAGFLGGLAAANVALKHRGLPELDVQEIARFEVISE
jgi:hypothetical protein